MEINWTGVYPAITTKFDSKDQLDLALFEKNIRFQMESGIDGIILGGTLGEASSLQEDEKEKLVKRTLEIVDGKIPVILNIAEQTTSGACSVADNAAKFGANGLMMLPPMRYKADDRETTTYFGAVAESTDLPIMIYNNPIDYKIMVTLEMFEELSTYSNIEAIKDSTRDTTNLTRMVNRFGDRYKILCGVDTLAMEYLALGASGWVAGLVCAFPQETVAIYRLMQAGRIDEARRIFRWFLPLLELDIHPKLVQYIKLAESIVGLGSEYVRAPRLILEGEEREEVMAIIKEGVDTRPELPDYLSIKI